MRLKDDDGTVKALPIVSPKLRKGKMRGECWEWQGVFHQDGYGRFWRKGKTCYAHRASWEAFKFKKIPPGMQIDHLCRNRKCVNPWHLEVVTPLENTLRGNSITMINKRKTHCIRGHRLSGKNLVATLRDNKPRRGCRTCIRAYLKEWEAKRKEARRALW